MLIYNITQKCDFSNIFVFMCGSLVGLVGNRQLSSSMVALRLTLALIARRENRQLLSSMVVALSLTLAPIVPRPLVGTWRSGGSGHMSSHKCDHLSSGIEGCTCNEEDKEETEVKAEDHEAARGDMGSVVCRIGSP